MQEQLNDLTERAKDKHKAHKSFISKLKKKPPKQRDYVMQELHDEEYQRTDCLE